MKQGVKLEGPFRPWCAALVLAGAVVAATPAQASLVDLGNGIVSDGATGLDWLKNADLAASNSFGVSGIGADGSMDWATAGRWIAAMNAADYLGHDDWRLPNTAAVAGGAYDVAFSYVGETDHGYNISAPGTAHAGSQASEMAYLYYNSLANPVLCGATGCPTFMLPALKTGPFENVQSTYWSGSTDPAYLDEPFSFVVGYPDVPYGEQQIAAPSSNFYAWAVRPATPATAVPEPAGWAMMLGGIGAAGGWARRRSPGRRAALARG